MDLEPGVRCIYDRPESRGGAFCSWSGPPPGSYMTPNFQLSRLSKGEMTLTLCSRHARKPVLGPPLDLRTHKRGA